MIEPVAGPYSDLDDAALVERTRQGETLAFAALYERYKGPLFRTALSLTRDRQAAEELLHDGFVRTLRHLARIRLERGASLGPWLHRIIINLAYDWSTRRARSETGLDGVVERLVAHSRSPESHAEQRELQQLVARAVTRLPFKQRIVVVLFYVHDMDLVEIAELLNLPEGTVKSRLYYARAKLRAIIESDARLAAVSPVRYVPARPPAA